MAVGKADLQATINARKGASYEAEYVTLSENWDLRGIPSLIADPSGQQRRPVEVASFSNKGFVAYGPATGATGTGANLQGAPWTPGGTVTHPNPTSGVLNQRKRTRFVDVITTTNQELGVRFNATSELQFWRGNAAGLGGFFFACAFVLSGSTQAATTRLFAGMKDSVTGAVVADAMAGNVIGLWHDTTDAAGVLSLVLCQAGVAVKVAIAGLPANCLAAGQGYAFYMACAPNSSQIFYRLDDLLAGVTLVDSFVSTATNPLQMPLATAFMGPQLEASNGTANIVAGDTGIDVLYAYCEG